jgi:hypothetical protein
MQNLEAQNPNDESHRPSTSSPRLGTDAARFAENTACSRLVRQGSAAAARPRGKRHRGTRRCCCAFPREPICGDGICVRHHYATKHTCWSSEPGGASHFDTRRCAREHHHTEPAGTGRTDCSERRGYADHIGAGRSICLFDF